MKIVSQEFKTILTVTCDGSERETTRDWLTNHDYSPKGEVQISSDNFYITSEKSLLIKLLDDETISPSALGAARNALQKIELQSYKILDDEFCEPSIEKTAIFEFPSCVRFQTQQLGVDVVVYVQEVDRGFKVTGYSYPNQ